MTDPSAMLARINAATDSWGVWVAGDGEVYIAGGLPIARILKRHEGQPLTAADLQLTRAVTPEQPPKDPRERALRLRRHRNTGPQSRLDGRRA